MIIKDEVLLTMQHRRLSANAVVVYLHALKRRQRFMLPTCDIISVKLADFYYKMTPQAFRKARKELVMKDFMDNVKDQDRKPLRDWFRLNVY